MQHNPCFNPAQKTAVISLHYFDLYTAHNISHLFTEAIVSDNYSFQQYKHHVGQWTWGTVHFINNMPCQLKQAKLWMDEYCKKWACIWYKFMYHHSCYHISAHSQEAATSYSTEWCVDTLSGDTNIYCNLPFFGYTCLRMYSKIKI